MRKLLRIKLNNCQTSPSSSSWRPQYYPLRMNTLRLILEYSFLSLYAVTLFVSVYRYPKYFDTRLQYLPIIYCYTFLNEVLGYITSQLPQFGFFSKDSISHYNVVIYNVYNLIFFLYFMTLYYYYIHSKKSKKLILICLAIFLIVVTVNPIYQDYLMSTQTATYLTGGTILILCAALYIKEQLKRDRELLLKNNPFVWISFGILVFYTGYLPIKIMRYFHVLYNTSEAPTVRIIHYSLIIAMYLFNIIGFILLRKRLSR